MRIRKDERGTLALTLSQTFMGALTIGIATFRGTESYEGFFVENQVAHATYAASKVSADHARGANTVATNNVLSASILGPRFAVEADNMTMIANAFIACPQWKNPMMVRICQQFHANYPRMLAKLGWVRAQQKLVWGQLGNLSSTIDKVLAVKAGEQIASMTRGVDSLVDIRIDDPALSMSLWGGDNISVACEDAMKDVLPSPIPGAAFPVLINQNLFPGMPKSLTQIMPRLLCGIAKQVPVRLGEIPQVAKRATEECDALERETMHGFAHEAGLSTDASRFIRCGEAVESNGTMCHFDRKACEEDRLEASSSDFLQSVGLPRPDANVIGELGGGTRSPSDGDWNHSSTFRACSTASRPIDPGILRINDASRTILSFGQAGPSSALRKRRDYQACGRWYFPDKEGTFAGVAPDQQPFVAAWKYALVAGKKGGKR